MTEQLMSQAAVARELGVQRAAVANWLNRHADSVPRPAAYVDERIPLWRREQLSEWWAFKRRGDLPQSATFCCGGLRALVQIGPGLYGVFEYEPDEQGRPRHGYVPSSERHVCPPRG